MKEGWSVREIERKASSEKRPTRRKERRPKGPVVRALETALQDHLGTRVEVIEGRSGDGSIRIQYHNPDDFERIFELVTSRNVSEVIE